MARRNDGLSDRHRKIMEYLTVFQDKNGYSPSIRQIGENIGVKSTSLVDYYLNFLQEMGYIVRDDHVSRSIRVLKPVHLTPAPGKRVSLLQAVRSSASEILNIPLYGRIVASAPLPMPTSDLGYFDAESSIEIARSMLPAREKSEDLFALEVDGDSMIDAMVNDGDIVVMRKSVEANNGEMVAVWLDDENATTLKYFYREKDRIRLQPANPTMKPIMINNPGALRIMGKVVLVIRQMKNPA
ncbi:MAG: transcriptional repressor LexA [Anaerolineaceae bacterium]